MSRAVFSKGVEGRTQEWVRAILRGLQGGRAVIRLACCTGVLIGLKGLPLREISDGKVEDEVIIALAEVMDDYNADTGDWEKEFRPKLDASQSLPSIPKAKLRALPLSLLAQLSMSTLASAFQEGSFLKGRPEQSIDLASKSPTMLALAGLSKLAAFTIETSIESSPQGLQDAYDSVQNFQVMANRIEKDWRDPETIPPSDAAWLLLKTFLFSAIMIADSVLGAAVYVRPGGFSEVSPHVLAKSILRTLSHLSFVISHFGGVTVTIVSDDPGFVELRKVFYLALDVLASQEPTGDFNYCESFVKELVADLGADTFVPRGTSSRHSEAFKQAKTAYTLACIEQLVPSLGIPCLMDHNSQGGRLSTAQLRLAYAALVRCASSSGTNSEARQLGWYCIDVILDVIRGLLSEGAQGSGGQDSQQRLHRLQLTLISTVSSLPLPLMIRTLEEIRNIITRPRQSDSGVEMEEHVVEEERRRKELVDALFVEILEKVGDQEKEAAMRWWHIHRQSLLVEVSQEMGDESQGTGMSVEEDKPSHDPMPRL
ncbi:hypothetical protein H0H87_006693 [Tephrocybe sp. NHM501043]|nr:hypothetical protein H0H87_006693 [Tephrocybe sp. NHM501043]